MSTEREREQPEQDNKRLSDEVTFECGVSAAFNLGPDAGLVWFGPPTNGSRSRIECPLVEPRKFISIDAISGVALYSLSHPPPLRSISKGC